MGKKVTLAHPTFAIAHYIVAVVGLLIPPFFTLAFPVWFGVLANHMHVSGLNKEPLQRRRYENYVGVGWTAWLFGVVGWITLILSLVVRIPLPLPQLVDLN